MKSNKPSALPEPDAASRARSTELVGLIRQSIVAQGGQIGFADFMQQALYTPGLGYYSSGQQKFGRRGDFITAPEVSPLFGQCLANQVAEIFAAMPASVSTPDLLEFGAGSGVLAADLLTTLAQLDALPQHYYILELSAELRQRQQAHLQQAAPQLFERVCWLDQLPATPLNAVVIANEVLDAMPVTCFSMRDGEIESLVIEQQGDALAARYVAADEDVRSRVAIIEQRCGQPLPPAYCSEYNAAVAPWLSALSASLEHAVVLLIDYGYHAREYYHPDRVNGTLMCYYQHRAHSDALWYPGLQDITAFVDFTDVAYSAVDCGFSVAGYTTQAAFLLANGLATLHAQQVNDDLTQQVKLSQQIKTLTLPSEMGERFKVMALTKNFDATPGGFAMQDYRNRL